MHFFDLLLSVCSRIIIIIHSPLVTVAFLILLIHPLHCFYYYLFTSCLGVPIDICFVISLTVFTLLRYLTYNTLIVVTIFYYLKVKSVRCNVSTFIVRGIAGGSGKQRSLVDTWYVDVQKEEKNNCMSFFSYFWLLLSCCTTFILFNYCNYYYTAVELPQRL